MNHTHAPECRAAVARFGLGLAAALLVLGVLAILSIGAVLLLAGLVVGVASFLALGSDHVGSAAPGRSVMRGAGAVLVVVGLMISAAVIWLSDRPTRIGDEFGMSRIRHVVVAEVAVEPVGHEQILVVQGQDDVGDEAGDAAGQRPALQLLVSHVDHLVRRPAPVVAVKADDVARQRGSDKALGRVRVVLPADLQRDQAVVADAAPLLANGEPEPFMTRIALLTT